VYAKKLIEIGFPAEIDVPGQQALSPLPVILKFKMIMIDKL